MRILPEQNQSQGPPDDRRLGYRADIQGLRAIAVLAVVANHLAGWPTGGFVGVDVFFVISGYLITGILMREFETRQTISFRGFYARRIKRILPAGLFVIGIPPRGCRAKTRAIGRAASKKTQRNVCTTDRRRHHTAAAVTSRERTPASASSS
jgi:hypothetical protein